MNESNQAKDVEINIETLMEEIRQQILAKQTVLGSESKPIVAISGQRLSPDFYEHLYQAALIHNQIGVKLHVTKVNVPFLGPIIEKMRAKLHTLVLFYVNQLASEQIQFNTHILQAINLLAQELEEEDR